MRRRDHNRRAVRRRRYHQVDRIRRDQRHIRRDDQDGVRVDQGLLGELDRSVVSQFEFGLVQEVDAQPPGFVTRRGVARGDRNPVHGFGSGQRAHDIVQHRQHQSVALIDIQ